MGRNDRRNETVFKDKSNSELYDLATDSSLDDLDKQDVRSEIKQRPGFFSWLTGK